MNNHKTMVVGLTGQTGAGKSTLAQMFTDRGIQIIDADLVARDTIEQSAGCLSELVLEFSTEVIRPDATLNREKLASICFADKQKLKRLNEITFPYIIQAIVHKLEQARMNNLPMVVLDAPTLYESGLDRRCDYVMAVIADREVRLRRIIERDQMTEEAALRRINAQNEDKFYTSRASDIITNNEDMDALRFAFMAVLERLETLQKQQLEQADEFDKGVFAELETDQE